MKILKLPQLRQVYNYDCGANALQAVLAYYGTEVREEFVIKYAETNKEGTTVQGLKRAARYFGLKIKAGRMTVAMLKEYIKKNIPVIIVLQAWSDQTPHDYSQDWANGHYVTAIGYNKNKIIFEDLSSFFRTYLTVHELVKRWHDRDVNGRKYYNWGMAVWGKKHEYKGEKIIHME